MKPEFQAAWPWRKRIVTAAAATGVVLATALVLGGVSYGLGRALGWLETNSIKQLVYSRAMKDPQLLAAGKEALTKTGCVNEQLGFGYTYREPLRLKTDAGEPCSQLGLTAAGGGTAWVYVSRREVAKPEVITQLASSLTTPETDTLPHETLAVSSVWGVRDHAPYQAYLAAVDNQATWLVEYYPADPAGLPAVKDLVKSLRLN